MSSDPFEEYDRMAEHPFGSEGHESPSVFLDRHLSECADFTLREEIDTETLVIWYQCIECDSIFNENNWNVEALTYDAFRYTVPIVHPSKYRPRGSV